MENGYSLTALMDFIDYTGRKGLLNKNTAQSRRLAVNKILSVLDEDEATDLRKVDIDQVYERFENLYGSEFKPDSLRVYYSRLNSAISDFLTWKKNPSSFKPTVQKRKHKLSTANSRSESVKRDSPSKATANGLPSATETEIDGLSIPIPLRPGKLVEIRGIPEDLTSGEARKIAGVITAYAASSEE